MPFGKVPGTESPLVYTNFTFLGIFAAVIVVSAAVIWALVQGPWGAAVAALFVVCFLLGSIPWGVVISRTFFHKDIRNEGSGNIGTTNAMRTMGKKAGSAVFVLDFAKGLVSGFIGLAVAGHLAATQPDGIAAVAAFIGTLPAGAEIDAAAQADIGDAARTTCLGVAILGCTWGHIFSPWLGFKGGKGIAVAVGALFVVFGPVGALLELAVFIVCVASTRIVSVGSLAAAIACPFFSAYFFLVAQWNPIAFACLTACALTVIWAHRGNIARLCAGTERRIGDKKKAQQEEGK